MTINEIKTCFNTYANIQYIMTFYGNGSDDVKASTHANLRIMSAYKKAIEHYDEMLEVYEAKDENELRQMAIEHAEDNDVYYVERFHDDESNVGIMSNYILSTTINDYIDGHISRKVDDVLNALDLSDEELLLWYWLYGDED